MHIRDCEFAGHRYIWAFEKGSVDAAIDEGVKMTGAKRVLICHQKSHRVNLRSNRDYAVDIVSYINAGKVLGKTFDFIVMNDVSALTPNTFCQISETLVGGGILCLLLPEGCVPQKVVAHSRFKTHLFPSVPKSLFMQRTCALLKASPYVAFTDESMRLKNKPACLLENVMDVQKPTTSEYPAHLMQFGKFLDLCVTNDQQECLKSLLTMAVNRSRGLVCLTAPRGRGKSAVLGLIAGAFADILQTDVLVTGPGLDQVKIIFKFAKLFLQQNDDAVHLKFASAKIEFREIKDIVAHASPSSVVIIDEAAAIPTDDLKTILRTHRKNLVIVASSIGGYEGTGRSFSIKLLAEIKQCGSNFTHLVLNQPIRYGINDGLECLTNQLFVLDAELTDLSEAEAKKLELAHVRKSVLFDGNHEKDMYEIMSLFVLSHYRNSPNDLLLLADSPGQEIFVVRNPDSGAVLAAMQVTLDGGLPENVDRSRGAQANGDMVTWKMCEWGNWDPQQIGLRIVRIAVHERLQRKKIGRFFVTSIVDGAMYNKWEQYNVMGDCFQPAEGSLCHKIGWVASAFGLTSKLLTFWRKCGLCIVYSATQPNEVTGEMSCIVLRRHDGLKYEHEDYLMRLAKVAHMMPEKNFPSSLVANMFITAANEGVFQNPFTCTLQKTDEDRMERYTTKQADRALIRHVCGDLTRVILTHKNDLTALQATILAGLCLQCKTVDQLSRELDLTGEQILSTFRRISPLLKSKFSPKRARLSKFKNLGDK